MSRMYSGSTFPRTSLVNVFGCACVLPDSALFKPFRFRLRINRRRQVGEGESPTCFESGRRILRPVFGQIGDKLVVSDVLRPILAHVRSKYSNTQHRIRNLEPQTDARNKFCGALDLNSKPAKTKRSRQIICQVSGGDWAAMQPPMWAL